MLPHDEEAAKRLRARLLAAKYDPTCNPPKDHEIFTVDGRTVGSLGNFIAFTGPPKIGKSVFLAGALASTGIPGDIWGMKLTPPEGRRLVQQYDTEQSLYQFHSRMNLAKAMMGRDILPGYISSFLFRGEEPDAMLDMMEYGIAYNKEVSIVFIDGLLDLCVNFNSEVESQKVSLWLRRVTKQYNVLIVSVIHTSKRDKFSIGHLGSAVDRYGQSILLVDKDETRKFITLSPVYLKDSIEEFAPVTIMFDGERFVKADVDIKARNEKKDQIPEGVQVTEHKYMISKCVYNEGITYQQLIDNLSELKGLSKARCKQFVRYWIEQDLVLKDREGIYHKSKEAKLFITKS